MTGPSRTGPSDGRDAHAPEAITMSNRTHSGWSRRKLIRRLAFVGPVGGLARVTRANPADGANDFSSLDSRDAVSRQGCGAICDVTPDERFHLAMQLDTLPAATSETRVLHITSNNEATHDYGFSVVRLVDHDVTLGTVADHHLSYDYAFGPRHTTAQSGEFFIVVRTDAGIYLAFQPRQIGPQDPWQTHDIGAALVGTGAPWRARRVLPASVTDDTVGALLAADLGGMDARFATRLCTQAVLGLREPQAPERIANPLATFGRKAQILGVGVGIGGIDQSTVTDVRFDDLILETATETEHFPWPAGIQVGLDIEGGPVTARAGTVTARLTAGDALSAFLPEAIVPTSLTVTPYMAVAPLGTVSCVPPAHVTVHDEHIELQINARSLAERLASGEQTVLVTGSVESNAVGRPVTVFGRETVTVA